MNDIQRDGRPHSAVGIDVTSHYVRAGVASAYPHPNQFFHQKVQRGQTVYVNTDLTIGGLGGSVIGTTSSGPGLRSRSGCGRWWRRRSRSRKRSRRPGRCARISRPKSTGTR